MHDLIVWIQEVAVPSLGWFGMYIVATLDASFVPLPELCDLLVVTGAAHTPGSAWKFVLASALGSMSGCLIIYEMVRRGGEKLAARYVSAQRLTQAKNLITKYGVLAIAIPAMSPPPVPFKGFIIAAGLFAMARARFAATVFIARAIRFGVWGLLGAYYGDRAIGWVKGLDVWMQDHLLLVGGVLAAIVLAIVIWWKRSQKKAPEKAA